MSQCVASLHKLIHGEEGGRKAAEIIACVCFDKQAGKLRRGVGVIRGMERGASKRGQLRNDSAILLPRSLTRQPVVS